MCHLHLKDAVKEVSPVQRQKWMKWSEVVLQPKKRIV